ncbi:TIGR02569 family protein [Corynebacterium sp. sy017]|uniref:TIGR02569 family protein n=1 Tax=unclassified Corynebacterium TaxID=2624378 RepID=UPI001184C796|nr:MULTISPECIES: TIGR02569 family protein [unclassified Corynebacterium]MBP3088754.1 TIGR02569 family protein [Corynebacterium sp. sy017]TSD92035.1 TIGR02569 family protein [Corynebacterium sp. SY003]
MDHQNLPDHVRDAFHASHASAHILDVAWGYGWRVDDLVLSAVTRHDHSAWSARIREKLNVHGLRIVRPVRATDGRFISAGWCANTFVEGKIEPRVDETVAAALRLDTMLGQLDIPDFFHEPDPTDIFALADVHAWLPNPAHTLTFDQEIPTQRLAAELVTQLAPYFSLIDAPRQVNHADMMATTIYAGSQAPVLTELVGVARPYGYSAALAIIDALLIGATDEKIIDRFAHIAHRDQLLLRALTYRICLHAYHPEAKQKAGENLKWVTSALISRLSAKL